MSIVNHLRKEQLISSNFSSTGISSIIFGFDVSNHQPGFDITAALSAGYKFCMFKVSESNHYRDPLWPAFRDKAQQLGIPFAGYLYIRGNASAKEQAEVFLDHLGNLTIPVMLDFEDTDHPVTMDLFWEIKHEIETRGATVALSYIPQWFWQRIGKPDLSRVPGLVASHFINEPGSASHIYQYVTQNFWAAYGGKTPDILQFSDTATIAGTHPVDISAFQGTQEQLYALFHPHTGHPPTPKPQNTWKYNLWKILIRILIKILHTIKQSKN